MSECWWCWFYWQIIERPWFEALVHTLGEQSINMAVHSSRQSITGIKADDVSFGNNSLNANPFSCILISYRLFLENDILSFVYVNGHVTDQLFRFWECRLSECFISSYGQRNCYIADTELKCIEDVLGATLKQYRTSRLIYLRAQFL